MSFEQRLTRGRRGDPAALEDLFARWRPLLRLQARKLLGADVAARVDPSDVLQEAFTQAFQTLDHFRGQSEGEWVAWLRRIVAGQAAKVRRHHRADKRNVGYDQGLFEDGMMARAGTNPVTRLLDQEQAARLAGAIEVLPEPMREVVLRRVFHQQPFEVIAGLLGRTPGAARVLWTRALRLLRDTLEKNDR